MEEENKNLQNKDNQNINFASQKKNEQVSFPVDLTKEEFVKFNTIVSQTNGILRFRKGQSVSFILLAIISFVMLFSDAFLYKKVDMLLIVVIIFLAIVGGSLIFGLPAYVKHAAERTYEQRILSGNSYYGVIRVFSDRLEKQTGQATVRLHFSNETIYIETQNMMILISSGTPAIVLPARCLMKKDADNVRRAILPSIPAQRQKLIGRLVPLAKQHIEAPSIIENNMETDLEEELLKVDVTYTQEEFIKLATDSAGHAFLKLLPIYTCFSIFVALLIGILQNFGIGILIFLLIIGALFVTQMFGAKIRAKRIYEKIPENGTRIAVKFTERCIAIRSYISGQAQRLAWETITRAVERPNCIEFMTPTAFLRIPKRCFKDINELKKLVDSHIRPLSERQTKHK